MRRFAVLATLLTLPTGRLAAQHAGQFEAGAFGSYTRYDAAFDLPNKVGGGVRLGYFFGDAVGLEADVLFQPQYTVSSGGTPTTLEPLIGSASLVFNALHGSRLMLYVLGGYSLLDFGTRAPYRFTDNAMHGGAGARIFLTQRVALRLEGRGVYVPSTKFAFGPTTATHFVATAGLSVFHLGEPPKDSDKDGVTDKKDACPNTPLGATVDPRGCPTDSDADGVPDGIDQCPNTPAGVHVDAKGCPLDSDGDGVPDGIDQCANTPAGATVDAVGCPTDSDKDGVPDGLDQCPNTPAGAPVDPKGCPLPRQVIRDSDGDGVPDDRDKCPNTPAGSKVDANGCIILFQPEIVPGAPGAAPARPTLILRGVNFEWGRSALTRDSYAVLDQVAGSLRANPARKGVSPGRMVAKGYGASGFIAPNTTAAGRAQNRRVELHKLP